MGWILSAKSNTNTWFYLQSVGMKSIRVCIKSITETWSPCQINSSMSKLIDQEDEEKPFWLELELYIESRIKCDSSQIDTLEDFDKAALGYDTNDQSEQADDVLQFQNLIKDLNRQIGTGALKQSANSPQIVKMCMNHTTRCIKRFGQPGTNVDILKMFLRLLAK